MMKANKISKQLRQIIKQGNNKEIQQLFIDIVRAHREVFTEDNIPTLAGFLTENLYNAIISEYPDTKSYIGPVMISALVGPRVNDNPESNKLQDPVKLKFINAYKVYFEQFGISRTLYEWSNEEKSYFTQTSEHHYLDIIGKDCLGNTLKEATICLEEKFSRIYDKQKIKG